MFHHLPHIAIYLRVCYRGGGVDLEISSYKFVDFFVGMRVLVG
jgi:hypothetical protein